MNFLERIIPRANQFFLWIAGCAVVTIMLLAIGNMVIRAFYRPFGATYEVISLLITVVCVFSLGASQINKVHITVNLLVDKLPPKIRKPLEITVYFFNAILFSTVTWQFILYAGRLAERAYASDALKVPLAPLVYAVAFGFGFLSLVMIMDLFRLVRSDHQ
jgi:TRAP-type transport system small permease protein